MQERRRLSVGEWLDLVQKTKESILTDPAEFLGPDLPEEQLLRDAIDSVFQGFLEDQRLLANQTPKKFRIPDDLKH